MYKIDKESHVFLLSTHTSIYTDVKFNILRNRRQYRIDIGAHYLALFKLYNIGNIFNPCVNFFIFIMGTIIELPHIPLLKLNEVYR